MIASTLLALAAVAAPGAPERFLEPIPIERVKLAHPFFVDRLQANTRVTIPACLKLCEESGRIANFENAKAGQGERKGAPQDDADVYRTLEAIGWTLVTLDMPELEARADAIVDTIVAAQKPDGYLNTFVQLSPGKSPWQDLANGRELECGGHLIEAGIAYARGTGKTKLLDAGLKFAKLVGMTFGPGKTAVTGAHPGIELALAKLGEHTGDAQWIALAKSLVEARGVAQQKTISGDAGGACSLYCAAADVAMLAPDAALVEPLKAAWSDATAKSLITGGLSLGGGAGCDTCAGLAFAQWSQRMLILTGESQYADSVERALYNHAAAATNLAGDAVLDAPALESDGTVHRKSAGASACCLTNVARFWPQVPGMIFAQNGNTLYQTQLATAAVEVELAGAKVQAQMKSDLPLSGRCEAAITADKPGTWNVKLRKPSWNADVKVKHDMKEQEHDLWENEHGAGWVPFERAYETTDGFLIHFLAPVRRVKSDAQAGRVALTRGPLVHCLEGVDHSGSARAMVLAPEVSITVETAGTILGGTRVIRGRAKRSVTADGASSLKVATLTAIPYWLWDNRDAGDMVVWIAETAR